MKRWGLRLLAYYVAERWWVLVKMRKWTRKMQGWVSEVSRSWA